MRRSVGGAEDMWREMSSIVRFESAVALRKNEILQWFVAVRTHRDGGPHSKHDN